MAYIIVTLKLLLGLDDEKEVRMSEVGREVRSKLPVGKLHHNHPFFPELYHYDYTVCPVFLYFA